MPYTKRPNKSEPEDKPEQKLNILTDDDSAATDGKMKGMPESTHDITDKTNNERIMIISTL